MNEKDNLRGEVERIARTAHIPKERELIEDMKLLAESILNLYRRLERLEGLEEHP